jgi:hypothetical protein
MKLLPLLIFILVLSYQNFDQEAGQRFDVWQISGTNQEIAHFCHTVQPMSPFETVVVYVGNQTFELSG